MMTRNTFFTGCILGLALCLAGSCSKLSTNPNLNWSYGVYVNADSAFAPAASPTASRILAYAPMQALVIEAGTTMNVGTYAMHDSSSGTYIFYYNSGIQLYSASGSVVVTANDTKKMSGHYTANFNDGSQMTGSFSDIPIR